MNFLGRILCGYVEVTRYPCVSVMLTNLMYIALLLIVLDLWMQISFLFLWARWARFWSGRLHSTMELSWPTLSFSVFFVDRTLLNVSCIDGTMDCTLDTNCTCLRHCCCIVSPITAAILGMERFPTGLSLVLLFNCIAVFGPNIASGIEGAVSSQPFLTYKMFTGVVFLAAAAVMILLRFRMNRKLFSKC